MSYEIPKWRNMAGGLETALKNLCERYMLVIWYSAAYLVTSSGERNGRFLCNFHSLASSSQIAAHVIIGRLNSFGGSILLPSYSKPGQLDLRGWAPDWSVGPIGDWEASNLELMAIGANEVLHDTWEGSGEDRVGIGNCGVLHKPWGGSGVDSEGWRGNRVHGEARKQSEIKGRVGRCRNI